MSLVAKSKSPAVTVRFPSRELLKRLKVEASRSGRSFNSEIVYRLSQSLEAATVPAGGAQG
jgi:plasmid stability protein